MQQDNVKTLSPAIFDKVDQLAAPRLVEYGEQDPCAIGEMESAGLPGRGIAKPAPITAAARESREFGVTIEAQFEIGEYQIVILSAKDSTGLDTWLKQEKYKRIFRDPWGRWRGPPLLSRKSPICTSSKHSVNFAGDAFTLSSVAPADLCTHTHREIVLVRAWLVNAHSGLELPLRRVYRATHSLMKTPRSLFRSLVLALPLALSAAFVAPAANAFCGFYVAGADQKLFNNATTVVLMREGTRTVLSMQNNYQGPPENFAMVVPVPVVLQQDNVKTLSPAIFDKIDQLAAPRLVEYWEQDPCAAGLPEPGGLPGRGMAMASPVAGATKDSRELGVTIEAQFEVGEYQIVILSAKDSTGLDTWLKQEKYKIPEGAEPLLRPYVQAGSKFFVAKVNVEKVRFEKGMAKLSPLRFHYDSETFSLPVRLGLINANGKQDLIVHILAKQTRYEVANYKNVTIPTNLDVDEGARAQFGTFYAALFDRTLEENPKAVVTEYAWDASTCDPCPGPTLSPNDFATLGLDAMPTESDDSGPPSPPTPSPFLKEAPKNGAPGAKANPSPPTVPRRPNLGRWSPSGFVLTRLHARYGADSLGEDLVFRKADPIVGGREFLVAMPGKGAQDQEMRRLETGSQPGGVNNFQGRYAIRHPWKGAISCDKPRRGIWGGPPGGQPGNSTTVAKDVAFAPREGVKLASFVRHDVPEIHLQGAPIALTRVTHAGAAPQSDEPKVAPVPSAAPAASAASSPIPPPILSTGCGGCSMGDVNATKAAGAWLGLGLLVARLRRRKKQ